MLTLTRKPGEKIVITDAKTKGRIVIEFADYNTTQGARLLFDADRQYLINREEIDEDRRRKHGG